MCSALSGWYAPAVAARSGRCGRCGLTAVDCGQLSWRSGTEPIYRPPAPPGCREGGFCVLWGDAGGCRKLCRGGVFPSPAVCLCASVSDGANVRWRSKVSITERIG